jgi:AAA domain/CHC2 zinc finger
MTATAAADAWIEQARAVPIESEVARRGGLNLQRRGKELIGPCPRCGGDDRFAVNVIKQVFNCRGCGANGNVVALVQHIDGSDFIAAATTLAGERPQAKPNGKGHTNGKQGETAKPTQVVAGKWKYEDEAGELLFGVKRIEYQNPDGSFILKADGKRKKDFIPRRLDPRSGKWVSKLIIDGLPDVRIVPYRLPELIEAAGMGFFIVIVEGEAKVDLLRSWNVPATCCAGGADKWKPEHSAFLRDADVIILPDNDEAGRKHCDTVAASLQGIAASVRLLELPSLPPKGDIIDWAKAGGTVEQLHDLIEREAKPWAACSEADSKAGESTKDGDEQQHVFNAEGLNQMTFSPIKYVVPGYIVEGLTLFAGKPKIGKSWLLLHAAFAVAEGGLTLGNVQCEQGDVLYAALEDNPRRLQSRMTKLFGTQNWPARTSHANCHGSPREVSTSSRIGSRAQNGRGWSSSTRWP